MQGCNFPCLTNHQLHLTPLAHKNKKPPHRHTPTQTVINFLGYPLFYNPYHPPIKSNDFGNIEHLMMFVNFKRENEGVHCDA